MAPAAPISTGNGTIRREFALPLPQGRLRYEYRFCVALIPHNHCLSITETLIFWNIVSTAVCPSPPLSTEITVLKGSTIHHRLCLADDVCQHRPAGPGRAVPVRHSAISWMVATLDGIVEGTEAVFESKFMLPWSFSEEAAAEKYMPQLQHNMWVTHLCTPALSIITGGGKWVEIAIPMDLH